MAVQVDKILMELHYKGEGEKRWNFKVYLKHKQNHLIIKVLVWYRYAAIEEQFNMLYLI